MVARRGGEGGAIASLSSPAKRSRAAARLRCWERNSEATTVRTGTIASRFQPAKHPVRVTPLAWWGFPGGLGRGCGHGDRPSGAMRRLLEAALQYLLDLEATARIGTRRCYGTVGL